MARKGSRHCPEYLESPGKRLFRAVVDGWELSEHHLLLLEQAAAALDRAERCRAQITADGEVSVDRFSQKKPHVLLPAERDNRALFARLLRELGLDEVAAGAVGRPPGGG